MPGIRRIQLMDVEATKAEVLYVLPPEGHDEFLALIHREHHELDCVLCGDGDRRNMLKVSAHEINQIEAFLRENPHRDFQIWRSPTRMDRPVFLSPLPRPPKRRRGPTLADLATQAALKRGSELKMPDPADRRPFVRFRKRGQ